MILHEQSRNRGDTRPPSTDPLTRDMISPPLSQESAFDSNMIAPQVYSGLEYVSNKLQSNTLHLTLILSRGKPLPIGQGCNLTVFPVGTLSDNERHIFSKYIRRAARKYHLQPKWMALSSSSSGMDAMFNPEYLIDRSLKQNDVLISLEGLTILNIDRTYTLKQYLNALSTPWVTPNTMIDRIPSRIYTDACLYLLRQSVQSTGGRPFTKSFFYHAYNHLHFEDQLIVDIANEYFARYKQVAIVLPKPPPPEPIPEPELKPKVELKPDIKPDVVVSKPKEDKVEKQIVKKKEIAASSLATRRVSFAKALSPLRARTPHSASDVTPITRTEWNILVSDSTVGRKKPVQLTVPRDAGCVTDIEEDGVIYDFNWEDIEE
ncbi:hypothetical protein MGYG_07249 [Nannizzia gypsea CBS 118893]|uniref:DUF7582 domain-containing protein n=1 Tax=Arthroderma gypseum (strain ATCC MYA-4604 / CBS 118893) TaxID=535722 RepID=E4V2H7_ARTGP|nr:hypothetical protein MGYG_07249 [Nannizzia gypsea CBS 118893]EFR04242.1 hypothetical protein MGYG_07249 [Nannizzia gypsea CBS 118893]